MVAPRAWSPSTTFFVWPGCAATSSVTLLSPLAFAWRSRAASSFDSFPPGVLAGATAAVRTSVSTAPAKSRTARITFRGMPLPFLMCGAESGPAPLSPWNLDETIIGFQSSFLYQWWRGSGTSFRWSPLPPQVDVARAPQPEREDPESNAAAVAVFPLLVRLRHAAIVERRFEHGVLDA